MSNAHPTRSTNRKADERFFLEKNKTYVDNSGNKVRILEVGIKYANKEYSTIGVVTLLSGEQQTRSYSANGVYGSPTGALSIKKEYVEPIKVRLVVYKYKNEAPRSYSVTEAETAFGFSIERLLGGSVALISDQIIEVEDNSK